MRYIPYVQTNFVLGLDVDQGAEPFELTKRFLDRTPGAFPGFSLLSAFGDASPLNRTYQEEGRVIPFPFHFLDNNQAMNVRPKHYSWTEFYDHLIDLCRYSFSWRSIGRRLKTNGSTIPGWMNVVRAVSSEGFGRIRHHTEIRRRLDHDVELRAFFDQESTTVPAFYRERIRRELGPFAEWLPAGAIEHDPHTLLESPSRPVVPGTIAAAAASAAPIRR